VYAKVGEQAVAIHLRAAQLLRSCLVLVLCRSPIAEPALRVVNIAQACGGCG
jgi:hypothetical protein